MIVTETEAMKIIRREQERERKRKYRDSKKKLTVKLDLKRRANIGEYCMIIGLNSDEISRITSDTLYIVQSLI